MQICFQHVNVQNNVVGVTMTDSGSVYVFSVYTYIMANTSEIKVGNMNNICSVLEW